MRLRPIAPELELHCYVPYPEAKTSDRPELLRVGVVSCLHRSVPALGLKVAEEIREQVGELFGLVYDARRTGELYGRVIGGRNSPLLRCLFPRIPVARDVDVVGHHGEQRNGPFGQCGPHRIVTDEV
jgi:hypothetical protein